MRSFFKPVAMGAALLSVTGCGGTDVQNGMTLDLALITARARPISGAAGARELMNDQGTHAVFTSGFVTLGSVELLPCAEVGWKRFLRQLSPVGTAWAHHTATNPLRMDVPQVVSLGSADGTVIPLGTLRPAPGRYCHARLTFEPAGDDAQGLGAAAQGNAPVDMVGRSLHLRGTLSTGQDGEPQPFEVSFQTRASVDVLLEWVTLSEAEPHAQLVFALSWDTWLDGVSAEQPPANVDLVANVARSVVPPSSAAP
ncbi:hypothetical protein HV824_23795 [Myxococcus sp. AM009]|uniref:hypothetical protein n=1 Tax=unclassified Myxococcus TaxID=2648731 RepID=UPI0015958809|nr:MULTISPECIES: hypothetical protein [unclassified Myxococcus]NVJ01118.1 hypothetical protein [Myxococcus sp. AM009]NVJ16424.1 hypothetical protein [Myxococcus sp. AM010]